MSKRHLVSLSLLALLCTTAFAQTSKAPSNLKSSAPTVSILQLSERMRAAIQHQIAVEQYSSNLYLSYASYFADLGLDGCENFFRNSSAEESSHALIFFNHLIDRNEKLSLEPVGGSPELPTSVTEAFDRLLENEMKVTRAIHHLYTIALEEGDYASQAFLYPLLLMQVEEEKQAQDLVQLLHSGGEDPTFILLFDNKIAELTEGK